MGRYLNSWPATFREVRLSSCSVDKSGFIQYTSRVISGSGRYIAVSRPAGFGKRTTACMLADYYGCGSNAR